MTRNNLCIISISLCLLTSVECESAVWIGTKRKLFFIRDIYDVFFEIDNNYTAMRLYYHNLSQGRVSNINEKCFGFGF